ncbi:hypothetical protein GIB67_010589 [Kingdonia uniflora]|uniref:NOSIC domain-containing protein n=1 Tax=Kingdonia uniflora TaxID=39325 RepID=A0A7J7MAT8_9MAGN|nr:hypothetical protein GIB67_010589 [Kingdonia uniflora]
MPEIWETLNPAEDEVTTIQVINPKSCGGRGHHHPSVGLSKMLVLFETPAGFALFKVLDEGKLDKVEDLWKDFATSEAARQVVKLKAFTKFENTADALSAATQLIDRKPSKVLRKFLHTHCDGEKLAVADSKLGNAIKEKLQIDCVHNNTVMELMRATPASYPPLSSKSYFSKSYLVDTMIIQAIGLLNDLDKELNAYAMGVKEWYGWHFLELAKIVQDNIQYAKAVKLMSNILSEDVEADLKEASVISMGTEVSELDLTNIKEFCDQVLSLSEYRAQLYDYLKNRMNTIAPNLTAMVGELVGARLIAHGGRGRFLDLLPRRLLWPFDMILLGMAKIILWDWKIEPRNLEGRELGRSAGSTKGKPKIEFYDKDRKKGTGALLTTAKTYNPSADAVSVKSTKPQAEKSDSEEEKTTPKKRRHVEAELPQIEETTVTGDKKKKEKKADAEDGDLQIDEDNDTAKKDKKSQVETTTSQNEDQNAEDEVKEKKRREHSEVDEEEEAETRRRNTKRKERRATSNSRQELQATPANFEIFRSLFDVLL